MSKPDRRAETTPDAPPPGLTESQIAAATATGPVLVLAGAGTGKTKTLTAAVADRIGTRDIPADRILAVTFTNRAASEMARRIRLLLGETAAPRWIGAFHGLAARQLRIEPEVASLRPGFDILDADDSWRMVKRAMQALNLTAGDDNGLVVGRDPIKVMCNRLSRFKDHLVSPAEAPAFVDRTIAAAIAEGSPFDAPNLRASTAVYAEYQRMLRDANAADFGDLLLWPTRAMRSNHEYCARWAGRFDCGLADEYQDVNFAQYWWLRLLCAVHREIFAVGDDDQSIYGWRGADVSFIRRFSNDFPDGTQIRLEENFRSTAHILGSANAVIARDPSRLGKTLFTRKTSGDPIEVVSFDNAVAEAAGIVAELQRRHAEGLAWDDFAILYRNNALSRGYEEALMRARITYVLLGDVSFYQRAEVKDALAFLRLLSTPDDVQGDEAVRRVINIPARGLGPKAMALLEAEAAWRQVPLLAALETVDLPPKARSAGLGFVAAIRSVACAANATLSDQLSMLLETTGYRTMLRASRAEASEAQLENLQELIHLAGEFHTARELLDHAALATSREGEQEAHRVKLMTLHKAKGLEFTHVFLAAFEQGILPSGFGDLDEERRLAYVAITRGMRRVTISHCNYRRGPMRPSCFLDDIPTEHRVFNWLHSPIGGVPLEPAARPRDSTLRVTWLDA